MNQSSQQSMFPGSMLPEVAVKYFDQPIDAVFTRREFTVPCHIRELHSNMKIAKESDISAYKEYKKMLSMMWGYSHDQEKTKKDKKDRKKKK